MKPAPFEYVRPGTLVGALEALHTYRDVDAKVLAGGQSLVPMMNFRVVQPAILIDINRLIDLDYIEDRGGHIAVGALARHAKVKASPLIAEHVPLVAEAYGHVAHSTIRNRGTLAGNLVHADAASEMPAVMCTLGADLVLQSLRAQRVIPAVGFFQGVFATATEPDELLVEIRIPKRKSGEACAFEEVSLRQGDFAISAVAVKLALEGGRCVQAAVCVTGISDRPRRFEEAEKALVEGGTEDGVIAKAADLVLGAVEFSSSASVSAGYRRDVTRALVVRALSKARDRASEQA